MLLGYYLSWSINRFLKLISYGYIARIVGAATSHTIADLIASYLNPLLRVMIIGIVLGGTVPLLFIPLLEILIKKKE